ncbi:UxaA family hydrolase [Snuella sedimenti]|uniref:UxaA family hydrolase n=1 Tax=Snuella sedimenti TaxID=2798802 RepID=A0A8J7J4W8_9FLAO|nr:UxaA family hydrolase [Snuella sedimenti]MBJ6368618.1 UxaA family hydrolase [Snuella sedimenti]
MENSKQLIKLSNNDNVLVLTVDLNVGDVFTYAGTDYKVAEAIALGHKIAAKSINEGEKIIKFNMSIGSATRDIKIGEHIHLHNMKSDFIDTHTRES